MLTYSGSHTRPWYIFRHIFVCMSYGDLKTVSEICWTGSWSSLGKPIPKGGADRVSITLVATIVLMLRVHLRHRTRICVCAFFTSAAHVGSYVTNISLPSVTNTVSAIKKATPQKMSDFSAIFHGGLKCCLYCLKYWITFTKGLSNWEKVLNNQQEPQASQQRPKLNQKTGFFFGGGGQIAKKTTGKLSKRFPLRKAWPDVAFQEKSSKNRQWHKLG